MHKILAEPGILPYGLTVHMLPWAKGFFCGQVTIYHNQVYICTQALCQLPGSVQFNRVSRSLDSSNPHTKKLFFTARRGLFYFMTVRNSLVAAKHTLVRTIYKGTSGKHAFVWKFNDIPDRTHVAQQQPWLSPGSDASLSWFDSQPTVQNGPGFKVNTFF